MATAQTESVYLSGQGVVLLGARDSAGKHTGLRPVGNVSTLTMGFETEEFEHKESQSGARAVDLTLNTELNVTATMTLESLSRENLAVALYGTSSEITGASVSDESHVAKLGLWLTLANIQVSSVVVTDDPMTVTYELDKNYKVDAATGSIYIMTAAEQTAASATNPIAADDPLLISYDFANQEDIQAITSGSPPERWMRFNGLNTAKDDNPVVVDIFKAQLQPLAELALINDEISQMEVSVTCASDALQSTASKVFVIRQVTQLTS